MSATVDSIARKESEVIHDSLQVVVEVGVRWHGGICLPDDGSSKKESVTFKVFTFGDSHVIEKATSHEISVDSGRGKITVMDLNEHRRMMVKRNLLSWSLDIPIERKGGWMTAECYEKVKRIPAPLMEAFLCEFEKCTMISQEEEEKIVRQSIVLFGRNSRGVADACEAVSMFCTLGNFWEKFGIGKSVPIADMPFREYMMLKMMIGKENEASKVSSAPRRPLTKIAGAGGKPRASQGIVMDN
jgi:hypothetical protein